MNRPARITALPHVDIAHLSQKDKSICIALSRAIQHVEHPKLMGSRLPRYLVDAVLRWDRARMERIMRQPAAVEAVVAVFSARGLPKKLRADRADDTAPTALSETADLLGIAETTVRRKRRGTNHR